MNDKQYDEWLEKADKEHDINIAKNQFLNATNEIKRNLDKLRENILPNMETGQENTFYIECDMQTLDSIESALHHVLVNAIILEYKK